MARTGCGLKSDAEMEASAGHGLRDCGCFFFVRVIDETFRNPCAVIYIGGKAWTSAYGADRRTLVPAEYPSSHRRGWCHGGKCDP